METLPKKTLCEMKKKLLISQIFLLFIVLTLSLYSFVGEHQIRFVLNSDANTGLLVAINLLLNKFWNFQLTYIEHVKQLIDFSSAKAVQAYQTCSNKFLTSVLVQYAECAQSISKQQIRSQPAFTCSKLTMEAPEQCVKFVQW